STVRNDSSMKLFNARKKWQEAEARVALKNQRRNAHVVKPLKDLPDRDHWEALLTTNWQNLIDAPASVKADFRCIEIATKQTWKALRYAAEELRDDPVFVLPMVESCWWALECLGDNARRDEEVAAAALKQSSLAFECLPPEMREDLITLQEAVRSDGTALRYASKELRGDRSLVEAAVKLDGGDALQYAVEELRNDSRLVLEALKAPRGSSKALAFSSKLAADRAFVLEVLKKDGLSLQYVSPILKADTSVVLAALQQNGEALEFAPEKFQSSRKVVDVAVKQNPRALRFASETLRSDEELVKEVAQVDGSVLQYASETLCANKRVVNKAVAQSWEALPFEQVEEGLSIELLLDTVKQDWRAIKEILRKNPDPPEDFLVEAATINPEIVRAQELRGHRSVAAAALEGNGLMLHYLLPDLRADQELASIAVRQNPDAMGEVHPCLRRENDLLKLQKEGLVRRARLELRRRRAKSDTVAAEAVADHEMDRDGDVADWTEPIPEKLPEMLPDPPDPKMEKEVEAAEVESVRPDSADSAVNP
ncbi:RING-type domain-containing protein, partial [Durusdinium trenchii]